MPLFKELMLTTSVSQHIIEDILDGMKNIIVQKRFVLKQKSNF